MLFNLQFEDHGAVEFVETADDWEQEIGVLIDPDAFAEVWVGLVNEKDEWMMCCKILNFTPRRRS